MENRNPYGLAAFASQLSRSVADAVKASDARYYDAAHGVGTPPDAPQTRVSAPMKADLRPVDVALLADPTPARQPGNSYGVDVASLSQSLGTGRVEGAVKAADQVPIRGDGMDRHEPKPPTFIKDESSGGRVLEVVEASWNPRGADPLWAAWRLGLKDLQAFVLTPFPDSTPPREEPGSIGTPAPDSWTGQDARRSVEIDR